MLLPIIDDTPNDGTIYAAFAYCSLTDGRFLVMGKDITLSATYHDLGYVDCERKAIRALLFLNRISSNQHGASHRLGSRMDNLPEVNNR